MIRVKDLNKQIFPSSFLTYLPDTCDSCGSDTEVVETFSYLRCSNRHCISKITYRLFSLLRDLGITSLTIDDCFQFLNTFETSNPYSIFLYNPTEDGELYAGYGVDKSNVLYNELNKKRGMLLWEFIKIGNFDNLNNSAEKILRTYTDIFVFYTDLATGGIPFIQNLLLSDSDLNNHSDSICVDAVILYEIFVYYKEEIVDGLAGVVILTPPAKIGVLFANSVSSSYPSDKDFLLSVNTKLQNKIYLYPLYLLSSEVKLVYWEDYGLNISNSVIEEVKKSYPLIRIINSENIYDSLLEVLSRNE